MSTHEEIVSAPHEEIPDAMTPEWIPAPQMIKLKKNRGQWQKTKLYDCNIDSKMKEAKYTQKNIIFSKGHHKWTDVHLVTFCE